MDVDHLFSKNAAWVERTTQKDPEFFHRLVRLQEPEFLWIGCSDSRVPANDIVDLAPGELFVHRNIANLVVHTDINMLSVLQYAVEVLKVPHVIVCGHYGCGGVAAALTKKHLGIINKWLRNIKDVYRLHEGELKLLETKEDIQRRMVELNVVEQVNNICETSIIQRSWQEGSGPQVHGWVYDIADGRIKDLGVNYQSPEALHHLYRFDADSFRP